MFMHVEVREHAIPDLSERPRTRFWRENEELEAAGKQSVTRASFSTFRRYELCVRDGIRVRGVCQKRK